MNVKELCKIALMTGVLVICSWITIPAIIPFTLQTLALFLAVLLLGGRDTIISIMLYLVLGIIGLPVFSYFNSGLGYLLGPTGGYLFSFLLVPLIYWIFEHKISNYILKGIILFISMLLVEICGSVWYYIYSASSISFFNVLLVYVLPYLGFDALKLIIALIVDKKIHHIVK